MHLLSSFVRKISKAYLLMVFAMFGFADAAPAPPSSFLDWISGPPDVNGKSAYTAFHAETRLDSFNPQLSPNVSEATRNTSWRSVVSNLQPFRSTVDKNSQKIYWRKDFFDKCQSKTPCSFYGEIFDFNREFVSLRMESFAVFGHGIDDGKTWDIRPDKFRLVSSSRQGNDNFPGGIGRIFAPIHIVDGWHLSQTFNTFACLSYDAFRRGACQLFQPAFKDSVSLEIWSNFSTVFDGEEPGYSASAEYTHFDKAIVITQFMAGGQSRERYFIAANGDGRTRAFQAFGIVRWDDSARTSDGHYVVVARAVGLRRETDQAVTFGGMFERGRVDTIPAPAGLRLFHDDSALYPDSEQFKGCPSDYQSVGSFHLSRLTGASEIEDMSGFNTQSGGLLGVCFSPTHRPEILRSKSGCSTTNIRGAVFIDHASVELGISDHRQKLANIVNDWIVLCSITSSDHSVYFSLNSSPIVCPDGGEPSGAIFGYFDCYDAHRHRCERGHGSNVLTLCVIK